MAVKKRRRFLIDSLVFGALPYLNAAVEVTLNARCIVSLFVILKKLVLYSTDERCNAMSSMILSGYQGLSTQPAYFGGNKFYLAQTKGLLPLLLRRFVKRCGAETRNAPLAIQ